MPNLLVGMKISSILRFYNRFYGPKNQPIFLEPKNERTENVFLGISKNVPTDISYFWKFGMDGRKFREISGEILKKSTGFLIKSTKFCKIDQIL
jgi:hypothetical protein